MRRWSDKQVFLRRGVDIERAKRTGRRISTPYFNLVIAPALSEPAKIAVIVGRKFGSAVVRNRGKRRVRELARSVEDRLVDHYHVLVFPKAPVVTMGYSELTQIWERALHREGLLRE